MIHIRSLWCYVYCLVNKLIKIISVSEWWCDDDHLCHEHETWAIVAVSDEPELKKLKENYV